MKKEKPGIYSGPLGWGWCSMAEVAEIVGFSAPNLLTSYSASFQRRRI